MKATLLLLAVSSLFSNVYAGGYVVVTDQSGVHVLPAPSISNGASAAAVQGSSYYVGFPYQHGITDGRAYYSDTDEVKLSMNENYDAIIKGGKLGYTVSIGKQVFNVKTVISFALFIKRIKDNESHSFQLNDKCLAWVKGDKVLIGKQEFSTDSFFQFLN